jgi:hypothetical protein
VRVATLKRQYGASYCLSRLEVARRLICACLGEGYSIEFAAYAEPPDDVVTEASPGSFHRCLLSSPASKLPESTSLFDPGEEKKDRKV